MPAPWTHSWTNAPASALVARERRCTRCGCREMTDRSGPKRGLATWYVYPDGSAGRIRIDCRPMAAEACTSMQEEI